MLRYLSKLQATCKLHCITRIFTKRVEFESESELNYSIEYSRVYSQTYSSIDRLTCLLIDLAVKVIAKNYSEQ